MIQTTISPRVRARPGVLTAAQRALIEKNRRAAIKRLQCNKNRRQEDREITVAYECSVCGKTYPSTHAIYGHIGGHARYNSKCAHAASVPVRVPASYMADAPLPDLAPPPKRSRRAPPPPFSPFSIAPGSCYPQGGGRAAPAEPPAPAPAEPPAPKPPAPAYHPFCAQCGARFSAAAHRFCAACGEARMAVAV